MVRKGGSEQDHEQNQPPTPLPQDAGQRQSPEWWRPRLTAFPPFARSRQHQHGEPPSPPHHQKKIT